MATDKDFVRWLDNKAIGNGKGDAIRPYNKTLFDRGWDKIFGKCKFEENKLDKEDKAVRMSKVL